MQHVTNSTGDYHLEIDGVAVSASLNDEEIAYCRRIHFPTYTVWVLAMIVDGSEFAQFYQDSMCGRVGYCTNFTFECILA